MNKMKLLSKAIEIATIAHSGQFDRGGNPYILHPLKLQHWLRCESELIQCIAVLHDVVEDTNVTVEEIREQFGDFVADSVNRLTKKEGQSYEEYLEGIMLDRAATIVKIADLRHNSDIRRLKGVRPKDLERIQKYHESYLKLKESLEELSFE